MGWPFRGGQILCELAAVCDIINDDIREAHLQLPQRDTACGLMQMVVVEKRDDSFRGIIYGTV